MKNLPLISVAICTYNRANYLREAINSVLGQTRGDFELIICDDASTDDTPAVCMALEQQDARVRTLRHSKNVGMIANWNSGLAASRGRYYAKLDDDNRYLPKFLEKTVGMLEQNVEASFAFTDEWFINQAGERLTQVTEVNSKHYGRIGLPAGLQRDTPILAAKQSCGINATLFVREALTNAGGFREIGGTIADLDVFLNLAMQGRRACYVPERLAEYRSHSGMGTTDLVLNVNKARQEVAMWEAASFVGEAERLRRYQLAGAYLALSRTHIVNGDRAAARSAARLARHYASKNVHTLLLSSFLYLPDVFLKLALRRRYGSQLDALHKRQEQAEMLSA